MRILGVVTLVSPQGDFGGPVRVAVNQLAALRDRGHDVLLTGAHRGYGGDPPTTIDGVPAQLYPARQLVPGTGFSGLGAPALWSAMYRHARDFDVVHVHGARDLVTLPSARIAQRRGVPTVVQTHGMIDESAKALARPYDAVLTRSVLRRAKAVTYLTPEEKASLDVVGEGRVRLKSLLNGVPMDSAGTPRRDAPPHAVYLARLAPRKRPDYFVRAAVELARELPDARFTVFGPDEGEGAHVAALIAASDAKDRIVSPGALAPEETADGLRQASVYVLPSVDEPYPMSVLEAMSIGLPVIITDTCGLAGFVTEHDAGIVVDSSLEGLTDAMRRLLADRDLAAAMGSRGQAATRAHRSMQAIAEQLESLYEANLADQSHKGAQRRSTTSGRPTLGRTHS